MNRPAWAGLYRSILSDPESLKKLAETYGPHFIWQAISICVRDSKEFPDWVKDYLGQCANHIVSGKVNQARTRKKVLQIFGFPRKKPGPGGPREEVLKALFAFDFGLRLLQGQEGEKDDPVAARENAGIKFLPNTGDRSLQRYLRQQFQLGNLPLPETTKEWKPVLYRHLSAISNKLFEWVEVKDPQLPRKIIRR
jgi:hypothetical protein